MFGSQVPRQGPSPNFEKITFSVSFPFDRANYRQLNDAMNHTTPRNLKTEVGFTLKTLFVHTTPGEFKNVTCTVYFGFVIEENSVTLITRVSWLISFRKVPFTECFLRPRENEKPPGF